MKFFLKLCVLLSVVVGFSSCSSESPEFQDYDYLAVQLYGSSRWSIMDLKTGELVLRDEFANAPSLVCNGVFMVQSENYGFEYYNVSDARRPLGGGSFLGATVFNGSNVTLATKEDECISVIDLQGNVVKTLDTDVAGCYWFKAGLALFHNTANKCGVINTEGETVINAQYDQIEICADGTIICGSRGTENPEFITYYVKDKNGADLFTFNSEEYVWHGEFSNGLMPVVQGHEVIYLDKEGVKKGTLCRVDGDYYYRLTPCGYADGRSIFLEGEYYGLKDSDLNVILRAKYGWLTYIGEGRYIALQDGKYGVIDKDDNIVINFRYESLTRLNSNALLAYHDNRYAVIKMDGSELSNYNLELVSMAGYSYTRSNYLDPVQYAQNILNCFTVNSCRGYSSSSTVSDFSEYLGQPSYYRNQRVLNISPNDGIDNAATFVFEDAIAHQTYRTESYWYGYYTRRVPTGWQFRNQVRVQSVTTNFDISEYGLHEARIVEEFENVLSSRGYTRQDDNYWLSSEGCYVGLGYEDGQFELKYYFSDGSRDILERVERERRTHNNLMYN